MKRGAIIGIGSFGKVAEGGAVNWFANASLLAGSLSRRRGTTVIKACELRNVRRLRDGENSLAHKGFTASIEVTY
jgi:hypothetical protein